MLYREEGYGTLYTQLGPWLNKRWFSVLTTHLECKMKVRCKKDNGTKQRISLNCINKRNKTEESH